MKHDNRVLKMGVQNLNRYKAYSAINIADLVYAGRQLIFFHL
jgi:hypothetical protein